MVLVVEMLAVNAQIVSDRREINFRMCLEVKSGSCLWEEKMDLELVAE